MRHSKNRSRVSTLRFAVSIIIFFVIGLFLVLLLTGTCHPFIIKSGSMRPTLQEGDCVLARAYDQAAPERFDIVVLKNPENENEFLTKRIVGIPSDRIIARGGRIYINGELERLPFNEEERFNVDNTVFTLGEDEYFVVGDNKNRSFDSFQFGPVPRYLIVSKLVFIYWPPKRFGSID